MGPILRLSLFCAHFRAARGSSALWRKPNGLKEARPQFSGLSTQGCVFLNEFRTSWLTGMLGLDCIFHLLGITVNALLAAASEPGALKHGAAEASKRAALAIQ